jgi:predicted  nucleic acid-binding Zn-ribbon protein
VHPIRLYASDQLPDVPNPSRFTVTPELIALLALQDQDEAIDAIQSRVDALAPRVAELEKRVRQATDAVERAQSMLTAEEQRQVFLREKVAEHKAVLERNQAALDQVKTMRAATAAVTQLEQIRRVLADEESDLASVTRRLVDMRSTVDASHAAVKAIEAEQTDARAQIAAEREVIDVEMRAAREVRDARAALVSKAVLHKYDRIRVKKRPRAVFPLNVGACSACEVSIPVQRRYTMQNTGAIEMCEGCGVLLYAAV